MKNNSVVKIDIISVSSDPVVKCIILKSGYKVYDRPSIYRIADSLLMPGQKRQFDRV